jgi:bacillithiol system protein YtxJ
MKALNSVEYWNELKRKSEQFPVVILKHSNTCPISLGAYERIKEVEDEDLIDQDIHLLIVQNSRELSDKIAEDTDVKHESPQILVMRKGKVVYHASHEEVVGDKLVEAFNKAK